MRDQALDFLKRVVSTPSPSGFEQPVAELYREYVTPYADKVTTDIMGHVTAIINPDAPMRIMYAGHMDEIRLHRPLHRSGRLPLFQSDRGGPTPPPRSASA